jgi:[acyl-carrier-protein] S-malonyltransferase
MHAATVRPVAPCRASGRAASPPIATIPAVALPPPVADAAHSRFVQRVRRRWPAERALLPPGAPGSDEIAALVQALRARGISHVVECGPGKVLAGMAKRIDADLVSASLYDPATLAEVKGLLA